MGLQCKITDCPHQIFSFSTGSSAMKLKSIVAVVGRSKYSKVSIIRPGRSRLLEFEKKDSTGRLIETFSKYLDQVV